MEDYLDEELETFHAYAFLVKKDGLWGVIDPYGEGGCPGVFDFGERWDPTERPVDYTWEFRLDPL